MPIAAAADREIADATTRTRRLFFVYALLTAASICVLIGSGGLVTSKGAGLAVPDWPTSYGYNMFAFPVSRWVGGVLYEHAHRLIASAVGFLTIGLAIFAWRAEPRKWVRALAYAAVGAVIFQGVLGGLRVVWLKDSIGIFHALLAQAYLALVCLIALVASPAWLRRASTIQNPKSKIQNSDAALRALGRAALVATLLIYGQLALGAAMRHAHAGLSIPDFPRAYGRWWPRADAATVAQINAARDAAGQPPTTGAQIHLQMLHRFGALAVLMAVSLCAARAWRRRAALPAGVRRLALGWPVLIAAQIVLGIYTIWTNKAADVATLHVLVGAGALVWGVLLTARVREETHRLLAASAAAAAPVRRVSADSVNVATPTALAR